MRKCWLVHRSPHSMGEALAEVLRCPGKSGTPQGEVVVGGGVAGVAVVVAPAVDVVVVVVVVVVDGAGVVAVVGCIRYRAD